MAKIVVIISHPDDIHAIVVAHKLKERKIKPIILNCADFPMKWNLCLGFRENEKSWTIKSSDIEIKDQDVSYIWYRRSSPFMPSPYLESNETREFVISESRAAFQGWLLNLGNRVINPISSDHFAHRKPYQLYTAQSIGFKIPRTLITNSAEDANNFLQTAKSGVIFKPLTAPRHQVAETRSLTDIDPSKLLAVQVAPLIFQEKNSKES